MGLTDIDLGVRNIPFEPASNVGIYFLSTHHRRDQHTEQRAQVNKFSNRVRPQPDDDNSNRAHHVFTAYKTSVDKGRPRLKVMENNYSTSICVMKS